MKEKNKNEYLKNPDNLSEIHNIEKKNNEDGCLTKKEFYSKYAYKSIKDRINICSAILSGISVLNIPICILNGSDFYISGAWFYFFATVLFVVMLFLEKKKMFVIVFLIISILKPPVLAFIPIVLYFASIRCCFLLMSSVDEFNYMWNDYLENNNSK